MKPGGRSLSQEVLLSGGISMVFTPSCWKLLRNMPGPFSTYCMATWPLSLACISIIRPLPGLSKRWQEVFKLLLECQPPRGPCSWDAGESLASATELKGVKC